MIAPPTSAGGEAARLHLRGLQSALAGPFDLTLRAGECAAVTGASGAGKSLFLRMIADLDVNTGAVELDGRPREAFAPAEWRRAVGYVAAEAGWWTERVADHFAPADLARAKDLAARLGLSDELLAGQVARLSTGEKQRLAIIRTVLADGAALLLDEPTGALDPMSAERVAKLVRERMAAGVAVVMVTHDHALAARLATVRLRMADRRLEPGEAADRSAANPSDAAP